MTFFEARIAVDDVDLLNTYIELFQLIPDVIQIFIDREVDDLAPQLLTELRVYPGAVKYPIQWKSAKQRRAFFATNGFGRGIGAPRTGALGRGYRVFTERTAGTITEIGVENTVPYHKFVRGVEQQPFHANTGWGRDAEVTDKYGAILADRIETALIRGLYAVE